MRQPERHLLDLFSLLDEQNRATLLAFAEFLAARAEPEDLAEEPAVKEPEAITRPAKESVVAAIKRLSRTYYMLERREMLNETSSLMAQHVIHGRLAESVINDLEKLFAEHYTRYVKTLSDS